jgi:hypothetical protein
VFTALPSLLSFVTYSACLILGFRFKFNISLLFKIHISSMKGKESADGSCYYSNIPHLIISFRFTPGRAGGLPKRN